MKIIVYAITKNEEKFAKRWYESMKEADDIYVLDTGSTDKTISILKKLGVKIKKKKITPWRFDVARNESLKLVPEDTDICVCTDLDEVFNKGWRKILEELWQKDTTTCQYIYNWSIKNNVPQISFMYEKIHSRKGFKWIYPVHEILDNSIPKKTIYTKEIILNHYPDNTKSRSSYLELLELSVKENPNNDRNTHYLGREYMYYNRYNESINMLLKHLSLKTSTWLDERSASMRFISRNYIKLGRYEEDNMWLDKAIKETPYLRDPYIEKALLKYQQKEWHEVIKLINKALKIEINNRTYINEIFTFNNTPYDLLSIAYYNIGKYRLALLNINKALKIEKNDRLIQNKKLIKQKIREI